MFRERRISSNASDTPAAYAHTRSATATATSTFRVLALPNARSMETAAGSRDAEPAPVAGIDGLLTSTLHDERRPVNACRVGPKLARRGFGPPARPPLSACLTAPWSCEGDRGTHVRLFARDRRSVGGDARTDAAEATLRGVGERPGPRDGAGVGIERITEAAAGDEVPRSVGPAPAGNRRALVQARGVNGPDRARLV